MLFYESSSTYEEDSDSGQSIVREDVERDKSLDTNDLSWENILNTPKRNRKKRIWWVDNDSGEESSAHEVCDSSDFDFSQE